MLLFFKLIQQVFEETLLHTVKAEQET